MAGSTEDEEIATVGRRKMASRKRELTRRWESPGHPLAVDRREITGRVIENRVSDAVSVSTGEGDTPASW